MVREAEGEERPRRLWGRRGPHLQCCVWKELWEGERRGGGREGGKGKGGWGGREKGGEGESERGGEELVEADGGEGGVWGQGGETVGERGRGRKMKRSWGRGGDVLLALAPPVAGGEGSGLACACC